MSAAIAAADANREFSALLRGVREGRTYIVTSHGKPVAKIAPVTDDERVRGKGRALLFERLAAQAAIDAGRATRDDLYEE